MVAERRGIAHWIVLPALFLALMFGPLGLLLYLLIRKLSGRGGWSLDEAPAG